MTEANALRGEVSIALEGVSYVLRPSYEALIAIERQTECSLSILQLSAATGTLSVENAAVIVTECCRAQGRATENQSLTEFNPKRVGHLLIEAGLRTAFPIIATLMTGAISGGYTAKGEVKAGTLQ